MRHALLISVLCICLIASAQQLSPEKQRDACTFLESALAISQKIKPGQTRAELEKDFQTEGGITSPQQGRYVLKSCRYLKLDVEFKIADPKRKIETDFDPNDTIVSVSKLYVAYPASD